jgi:hypothetical protein
MARRTVHDDVNVENLPGHAFDGFQEAAEFLRPVSRHAFADYGSSLHVEEGNDAAPRSDIQAGAGPIAVGRGVPLAVDDLAAGKPA